MAQENIPSSNMQLIFYILVRENKSKKLEMRGPFIHMKPLELCKSELERYVFSDTDLKRESKFLNAKNSNDMVNYKTKQITVLTKAAIDSAYSEITEYFEKRFHMMQENYEVCIK